MGVNVKVEFNTTRRLITGEMMGQNESRDRNTRVRSVGASLLLILIFKSTTVLVLTHYI